MTIWKGLIKDKEVRVFDDGTAIFQAQVRKPDGWTTLNQISPKFALLILSTAFKAKLPKAKPVKDKPKKVTKQ